MRFYIEANDIYTRITLVTAVCNLAFMPIVTELFVVVLQTKRVAQYNAMVTLFDCLTIQYVSESSLMVRNKP